MRRASVDRVRWDWLQLGLPIAGALVLACGSAASPETGKAGASGAGTSGSTGTGGVATAGASSSDAGRSPVAGSSGSSAGASLGGAGQGGAPTPGAGGSVNGSPLVHSVCRQDASHLCTDSFHKDTKADADDACVNDGQGTVAEKCPIEGLIGCCFMPGEIVDGVILYGDVHYCFYEGDSSALREDTCLEVGGTWSKTPPP